MKNFQKKINKKADKLWNKYADGCCCEDTQILYYDDYVDLMLDMQDFYGKILTKLLKQHKEEMLEAFANGEYDIC